MFNLMLIILSFGALVLVLMPATVIGIISSIMMYILGISLIVYKKFYEVLFWKKKDNLLILATLLIVIINGLIFYNRWIPSSKMGVIASTIYMSVDAMLFVGTLVLSALSFYFTYVMLQITLKKFSTINAKNIIVRNLFFVLLSAVIIVILAQIMIEVTCFSMGFWNFIKGVLIVFVVILLFYCLSGRIISSILFGMGPFMIISTINAYVYIFRERLFEPVDIFSVGTAMNVVENYSLFPIPLNISISWSVFLVYIIVLCYLHSKDKSILELKKKIILFIICIIGTISIHFEIQNMQTYHWQKAGAEVNGYILDFVSKFKEITVAKPEKYSNEVITELSKQYMFDEGDYEIKQGDFPHVIAIMDESFSDLSVLGDFSTNEEVIPFISSLKENTISGYALASIYGGNTANSEYEFLTGNSLAGLSPNVVPYQQYIRSSTYSMVSYLKSAYDYNCIAMHPFYSNGWNRPVAYEHLGFDECYFVEDFPQQDYVREYISDREMFGFVIDTFEKQKENPLFMFGVSMQNHGGYTYNGENYTQSISLNDYCNEFPDVEQYLSLVHETDKAVEKLITYFENVDEDVVIVFYGDHQPRLNGLFYDKIEGESNDTLDEQQNLYKVPFFIWANYDIDEKYIDCTSLNYLSTYVYDVAGIALPPYNKFLRDMEKTIPSINANGYYSLTEGNYLPFDEASGEEQKWLELYDILQYNSIFDKKNRNEKLFPVLE